MSMRLKLLRKKLGVTLGTSADKTGLIKSYLPKVERGLDTPPIAIVPKLAKALGVQVKELLSEKSDGIDGYSVVRHDQRRPPPSGGDGPTYASFVQQIDAHALSPFITHPSRDFSHSTFREYLGEEFTFVHEDQVEVDFMDQRIILERDNTLHFSTQKPHRTRFLGEAQAELLVVIHSDE